jgi:hypothetical protein
VQKDVAVVVDAAACSLSTESAERKKPPFDGKRFMGAVRKIWMRRGCSERFSVTSPQVEKAIAAAAELDENVFLAAWNYWLETCGEELEVRDETTGKFVDRAWPLEYFMSSGALYTFAEDVRPVAGMAEDKTLQFLVDAHRKKPVPISVTNENLAIIGRALECCEMWELLSRYDGQPMDAFATEVVVPFEAERLREWEEERKKRRATALAQSANPSPPLFGASQ